MSQFDEVTVDVELDLEAQAAAWDDHLDREFGPGSAEAYHRHEAEVAAEVAEVERTGRHVCPTCRQRSVKEKVLPTRQYGGGYDTSYLCETPGCGYVDVAV